MELPVPTTTKVASLAHFILIDNTKQLSDSFTFSFSHLYWKKGQLLFFFNKSRYGHMDTVIFCCQDRRRADRYAL